MPQMSPISWSLYVFLFFFLFLFFNTFLSLYSVTTNTSSQEQCLFLGSCWTW